MIEDFGENEVIDESTYQAFKDYNYDGKLTHKLMNFEKLRATTINYQLPTGLFNVGGQDEMPLLKWISDGKRWVRPCRDKLIKF